MAHPKQVTRKRVFKEDSDESDSDDDHYAGFQKIKTASTEDRTKPDFTSSTSSSVASPINRLESDSESHSNESSDEVTTSKKFTTDKKGKLKNKLFLQMCVVNDFIAHFEHLVEKLHFGSVTAFFRKLGCGKSN